MIGKEIVSSRRLTLTEVYELLEERKKRGPLGYEQQTSYDYCERFKTLDKETCIKLVNELVNLGIEEDHAKVLVDVLPKYEVQVKVICNNSIDDATAKKVVELLKPYVSDRPGKSSKTKEEGKSTEEKEGNKEEGSKNKE